jgi:membrane-associated phospholipid phosphatase
VIWKAAKTSAMLCALFVGVYALCNYVTSLRLDVAEMYMEWEKDVPFVPLLILPYLSIDLFFIAAPFFCTSRRELKVLGWRMALCIIIAGACFMLFPMRFAFERPPTDGWLGQLFDAFRGIDMPFNQFPSLHIGLLTIMWVHYRRHLWGWVRPLFYLWFVLVGVSTMLVYQHHFIDVLGGVILGMTCLYLAQEEPLETRLIPNLHIAIAYGLAMALLLGLGVWLRPWGLLLLWPAFGCALAATGYLWLGPGLYRKKKGRLSLPTWLALWPVLGAQWLSLQYYARGSRLWDALTERVWIGRQLPELHAGNAIYAGVRAVLDLTGEFSEAATFRKTVYLQIPILDLTAPTQDQLAEGVAFIESQARHGIVYVHCKVGYSRTAAVAGAYLLKSGQAEGVEQAVAMLRQARRGMIIRPEALQSLEEFARRLRESRQAAGTMAAV